MWPPESPTMAEMSFVPMPVVVMMQAMIPATAQAAPTVSVLFAVSSRASKNLVKFILGVLTDKSQILIRYSKSEKVP